MASSYAFTDSDVAAQRLALLARVFDPSTLDFVRRSVTSSPELIVDLGCGPGYTTRLLAGAFPRSRVVGLDTSRRFIDLARHLQNNRISFRQHDVTLRPFPIEPADLLFCRFLFTHLSDPESIIRAWMTQLRPGGLLLIEEGEAIRTAHPLFASYLEIVAAMLRHQSNELYVGPILASIAASLGEETRLLRSNRVQTIPVPNANAAAMFALNLRAWRRNPFIHEHYDPGEIAELERRLTPLAHEESACSDITWELRQIVLENV